MKTAKEIFALRKEHHHAEALVAAQELYAASPDDPWSLRPLGWCFHDELSGCRQCNYAGITDPGERQKAVAKFAALPIPPDDKLLLQKRALHTDPLSAVLKEARRDQDEGRIEQAHVLLMQAWHGNHDHPQLNEQLAWMLLRLAYDELRKEAPAPQSIRGILAEYARLNVEKPSEIHSRMLGVAARASSHRFFPSFCRFLRWWDPRNFRESDWLRQINGEKKYDSLVEQTIRGIAKTFEEEQDHGAAQNGAEFILAHVSKYLDQEWFQYYAGEALLWMGRADEARKLLLPVLRVKAGEFWVWHILARTFPSGDPHRLSCLCKSMACTVKGPEFLLNVRVDLADELAASGHHDLARHEIQCVVDLRNARGWSVRDRLKELLGAEWFANATPCEDRDAYARWAEDAQEALTEDLPWHKAILAVPRALLGKDRRPGSLIDVATDASCVMSIPVRKKTFPQLETLKAGTALDARIVITGEYPLIVAIRLRIGEPWDILAPEDAIVEHINDVKGVTMLLLADGRLARAYHSDVENAAQTSIGSFVSCRFVDDRETAKVRWMETATHTPQSEFWRSYSGEFRPREKGGGHVGNVFIPARMSNGFITGSAVSGVAIQRTDRDTHRSWREALRAEMR